MMTRTRLIAVLVAIIGITSIAACAKKNQQGQGVNLVDGPSISLHRND